VCVQKKKEIPQVTDEKRNGCPNPYTDSQDLGSPGRVGYDLYSDWCKFRLGIQARIVTALLSLQATILASHAILLHFRLGALNDVFMPVGIQLVVRNNSKESPSSCIDSVI